MNESAYSSLGYWIQNIKFRHITLAAGNFRGGFCLCCAVRAGDKQGLGSQAQQQASSSAQQQAWQQHARHAGGLQQQQQQSHAY